MRVTIYSPIRLFGEALASCLRQESEVERAQCHADILGLVEALTAHGNEPDVVLFDTRSSDDVNAVRELSQHHRSIPIVALCVPRIADEVIACADAGFASYVPRDSSFTELVEITQMAVRGEMPCDPKISRSLLDEIRRRSAPDVAGCTPDLLAELTPRETEILRLLGRGLPNKEIATELGLSVATIKNHVHSVLQKLELRRRSEVAALLTRNPWLLRSA